jgi:acyl-CoA thioesterase I
MRLLAVVLALFLTASPALARPIHIVAFGDSLTSGWLVPRNRAYPAQLQRALRARGYDVTVKNAGIGGDTARHALRRFDMAIDPDTDICILEFGINDRGSGASIRTVHARVAELIRSLRARRIRVLLLGAGGLKMAKLAAAHDALYVDWTLPKGRYRARDHAHFNAQGYAILVARMLPKVETLIRQVRDTSAR